MTKEFTLHFTGSSTKVGMLNLQISPEVIALVIEIPRGQDTWFKNFRFDMEPCKVFLKLEFVEIDLTKAVPRDYIKDSYANLLFNIVILPVKPDIKRFIHIILNSSYILLV